MLIRLIPSPSHPTVLFKLTFENLPASLCNPPAWVNQLSVLACDDLEVPELMHALDRAVGVQSILEEVIFELGEQKVRCLFIDGEVEEWPMNDSANLIRRLWSVIEDVNECAAEMDRERKREEEEKERERRKAQEAEEEERARKEQQQQQQDEESLLPRTKRGHKKQRSLLMNLVSSLIPLSLNSPRTPRSLPSSSACSPAGSRDPSPSPSVRSSQSERVVQCSSAPATLSRSATFPASLHSRRPSSLAAASFSFPLPTEEAPAPVIPVPPPPPRLTPRALRRRARSTLVDSFRSFVLPELNHRIRSSTLADPSGSPTPYITDISAPYYPWVISSMIKRVDIRLHEVVREVKDELDELGQEGFDFGNWPLGILGSASPDAANFSPTLLGPPFGDEDDRGAATETDSQTTEDSETDTDSSLLHTPLSTNFGDPFIAMPSTGVATTSWAEATSMAPEPAENALVSVVNESLPKPKLSLTVPRLSSTSYVSLPSPTAVPPTHATNPVPPASLPTSLASVLAQHAHLTSIHAHLNHLLLVTRTKIAAAKADLSAREGVLEVRGRRKAWLNQCHGGVDLAPRVNSGSGSSNGWRGRMAMVAMATPFRPSGLGRFAWSSEEWECDPFSFKYSLNRNFSPTSPLSPAEIFSMEYYPNPFESEGNYSGVESGSFGHGYGYGHRRRRSSLSETSVKLFPVCESDEEEEGGEPAVKFSVPLTRRRFAHRRPIDIELDDDDDDDDEDDGDAHEDIADALVDIDLAGLARLEDGLGGLDGLDGIEGYDDNDDVEEGVVLRKAIRTRLLQRESIAPAVVNALPR